MSCVRLLMAFVLLSVAAWTVPVARAAAEKQNALVEAGMKVFRKRASIEVMELARSLKVREDDARVRAFRTEADAALVEVERELAASAGRLARETPEATERRLSEETMALARRTRPPGAGPYRSGATLPDSPRPAEELARLRRVEIDLFMAGKAGKLKWKMGFGEMMAWQLPALILWERIFSLDYQGDAFSAHFAASLGAIMVVVTGMAFKAVAVDKDPKHAAAWNIPSAIGLLFREFYYRRTAAPGHRRERFVERVQAELDRADPEVAQAGRELLEELRRTSGTGRRPRIRVATEAVRFRVDVGAAAPVVEGEAIGERRRGEESEPCLARTFHQVRR